MKIRSLMILSNLQSLMMQSIIVSYFNIRPPQLLLDVTCLFLHRPPQILKMASLLSHSHFGEILQKNKINQGWISSLKCHQFLPYLQKVP